MGAMVGAFSILKQKSMLPIIMRKGVEGKIARAIVKKKIQLVSMFIAGVVSGGSWLYNYQEVKVLFAEKDKAEIIFENHFALKAEAETIKEVKAVERDLADYIWMKESTRGKNNYSKCEAVGKVNGIGYGITNGKYMCFDSHEDEMKVLEGWIITKKAAGYTEQQLLSIYSGGSYNK